VDALSIIIRAVGIIAIRLVFHVEGYLQAQRSGKKKGATQAWQSEIEGID
jgi:hypothetical protein